jgi:hypothetical protein
MKKQKKTSSSSPTNFWSKLNKYFSYLKIYKEYKKPVVNNFKFCWLQK